MDCQNFRRLHSEFIDRTLSEVLVAAVYLHLQACGSCARRDATLRRGLFLSRNLREVRPSADFSRKLEQRLDVERDRIRDRIRVPRRVRAEVALRFAGAEPSSRRRVALS